MKGIECISDGKECNHGINSKGHQMCSMTKWEN